MVKVAYFAEKETGMSRDSAKNILLTVAHRSLFVSGILKRRHGLSNFALSHPASSRSSLLDYLGSA
jgi:hypothetical protein